MMCINCGEPADSLFVAYSKTHIRLTDCKACNAVVDKYIEYDDLLLFINLLLLKPGAYRHMVFNSSDQNQPHFSVASSRSNLNLSRINRIKFVMMTFEVYLTWAYEEKIFRMPELHKSLAMTKVFSKTPIAQYFYFMAYCVLDQFLLQFLSQRFFSSMIPAKLKKQSARIISSTLLLAYGARLFPILMLIWPYDSIIPSSVIKWVSHFYVVESLRITTNCSYKQVAFRFVLVTLIRIFIVNFAFSYAVVGAVKFTDILIFIFHQVVLV